MSDDFIYEEEVDSAGSANRRPFLIAVGVLLSIFVLAVICSAILLLTRGNENGATAEIAAIETKNAIVAVTNEAVTQTIAAMQTEAARPTDTPPAPPTNTPRPTSTPLPTNTPVVQAAEEETAAATPDLLASGTAVVDEDAAANTPTPIAALNGGNGGDGALPQTGIETWGVLVAALGLIAAFWGARRLRSS